MTAACPTFEEISSRAETTVAWAIHARRVRDGLLAVTIGTPVLGYLAHKLRQLNTTLKSGVLERLTDEQLKELAELLKQLDVYLAGIEKSAKDGGAFELPLLRISVRSIQGNAEDLRSILENIYLALDPSFHKAVSSAIDKLKLGVEERVSVLR